MSSRFPEHQAVSRVESLRVQNYRSLKDVELKNLTPLTVFLGPNGSGKPTLFDVFAFLSECFSEGLGRAWDCAAGSESCAAGVAGLWRVRAGVPRKAESSHHHLPRSD